MEIHILKEGEQIGPWSEEQVRQYLSEGVISPGDLATREGMSDWQPLDVVLSHLPAVPPPVPAQPGTHSGRNGEPEPTPPANGSKTLDRDRPPADLGLPLTASQRTKRKLNKIVIQPILPPGAIAPDPALKRKTRTGKTALAIEPPRPTTSLPPIDRPPPLAKGGRIPLRPGQLLRNGSPGNPPPTPADAPPSDAADRAASAPAVPLSKAAPTAVPGTPAVQTPWFPPLLRAQKAASSLKFRLPREIVYAALSLAFIIVCLVLSSYFVSSRHRDEASAASPDGPENPGASSRQADVLAMNPVTADDYSERGYARQSKGDLNGAIADYNRALELDPANVQACYRRGLAWETQGNWDEAIADYTRVLNLSPRDADAFSNRGFVKQSKGDLDGALADYAQALLINPKLPVAYYNEGLIKVQKGDLEGAIAAYDQALDLDPKMAIAYYNRGTVKSSEGNLDGAIADYTQALVLNPTIALAYANRGSARQSKGDLQGALDDFSQALGRDPKMDAALYNRGVIEEQQGNLDGALADSGRVLELDPKRVQAYYIRGLARFGKGNLDGALADLKQFCQLAPRDNDADPARLYIWLISTEENPQGNANQELASSMQTYWNAPPSELISKIAELLLGNITEAELIPDPNDPTQDAGQEGRAWYFAGMKRLLAGDISAAQDDFQKCVAQGKKDICEYHFARSELDTLPRNPPPSPKP